jgi:TolB-like protein
MKKIRLGLALLASAGMARAGVDPYETLVQKLSEKALAKVPDHKIAVLAFEYVDKRPSPGVRVVTEKLTNRFVEHGGWTVIERSMVEKLTQELEFQLSAAVDPESAKQIGKGLGVEAIVTGTLEEPKRGRVEVSARIIRAESYEILAAASVIVEKTWSDTPVEEAASSPASTRNVSRFRGPVHGFTDFFFGISDAKADLEFKNSRAIIDQSHLGFTGVTPNPFSSIGFTGLETKASPPVGFRVGGFGEIFGGDLELSIYSHSIKSQNTTHSVNGVNRGAFRFTADDYLKITVLNLLTGDFLMRLPVSDRAYPYVGLGFGLTLNTLTSNYVKSLAGSSVTASLNEISPGLLVRVPLGVRMKIGDKLGLFGEYRYVMNRVTFNREIANETDTLTLKGGQFLTGLSLMF